MLDIGTLLLFFKKKPKEVSKKDLPEVQQEVLEALRVIGCILNYCSIPEDSLIRQTSAITQIPEERIKEVFRLAKEMFFLRDAHL